MTDVDPEQIKDRRVNFVIRFVLENMGGIIAAAMVFFYAGQLKTTIEQHATALIEVKAAITKLDTETNTMRVDIAVVKAQTTAAEIRAKPATH